MELPGIYVVVKGDYTELQRNVKATQALVKSSAIEISNDLNNALAPEKIRNNINSMVAQFGTLNRASSVVGKAFDGLGVDLGELRKITGLSEDQFSSLQSRILRTQAANAQEAALKKLATAAGLTREEIKNLGQQFNLSSDQVEKVAYSVHGVEKKVRTLAEAIRSIPKIQQYVSLPQAATSSLNVKMDSGADQFAKELVSIPVASRAAHVAFESLERDMVELAVSTGLTIDQLGELKARAASTTAERTQESALRAVATAAGLTREEIKNLGSSMGVQAAGVNRVADAIHGAEAAVKSYADQIKALPKIPTLNTLSTGAQSQLFSGYSGQYAAMANDLTALTRAEDMAGKAADAFANDIYELGKHAKLTEEQMQDLQNRMSKTVVSSAQENALKRLAAQLRLTDAELEAFGRQFGLTATQMERIVGPAKTVERAVDGIGNTGNKKMSMFSGSIAMAAGKFLLLEQAAYSVQRILNATVFDFSATVETATIGISAAFLNNGQYVDQITGKVLTGQQAMKAAMQDADGVIQQLRASNMVTIATLDQLIKAYQEAAPVALSKGFNKYQVEQFTVAMMQAAGAVDTTGMLIGQMGEEVRSLLNGGINPKNTRIATALGITNEDVGRYKGDIQGLFNFLMSKLAAYQAFGDQLQKTWRGVASNTADIFKQVSSQATEPLFIAVRDGLYEWQQGIAKVVVKTDELGNVTRTLEWNPEYQRSVEQVRGTIEALIGTVRDNRDIIGALFEAGGSAALQSLDGINQVLVLLGNVVTTAKQGVAEIKALAGIKVDIPVPWDIPGAMLNGVRKANMEWTKINDEWSGKRDDSGNLSSGTAQEVAIDRIQQRVKSLKQELSVAENSISSLVFGDRTPEQIKADIAGAESQLKSLSDRVKGGIGTAAVYQPSQNTSASEEWNTGREKFLESLKTEREKALADYEEQKQYVKTVEEGQKLRAQLSEKLASIDSKAAKSSQAASLKAERSALKELNAEITGYTAEARAAGDAALKWNRDAQDSLEGIQKLNNELGTSGMSDFGRMAYDSAQLVKQGTKDVEAYQLAVSQAGNQITITGAAYDKANERLKQAKAALAANGVGSDAQDANKVRALEKEVVELDAQLREHTQVYYDLTEAQKSAIKTVEELQAAAKDTLAFETAMQGYQELGLITGEFYDELEKRESQRRKDFVSNGGDPGIAQQLEYATTLKDRTALANTEYLKSGSLDRLIGTGLENYKISVDQDAIRFYSDLLPNAIDESTGAMAEFFRDIAQGNATLSESWEELGNSVENVVFDILQDLLQLQLKMVVLGSLGITGSGATTGGGLVGMISGLFHTGGVVGYEGGARAVSSSLFTGAPRYHTGLQGNEFPAILKKGESVLTEGQMAAVGAGLSASKQNNVTVNVIESPNKAGTTEQRNQGGASIIDVFVDRIKSAVASDIASGSGVIPGALQSTYGLNRSFGGN